MGEDAKTILAVGCPSSDIARRLDRTLRSEVIDANGSGAPIDPAKPFLLVVFHPTTTAFGSERDQMGELLQALHILKTQTLLLWPNIDAGADHISKAIRSFRDERKPTWLRTVTNLSPEDYLRVLANTSCAIGNSSSFVRDASYFGVPIVLVGNRQEGRETDVHVTPVRPNVSEIISAVRSQLEHGPYPPSTLYGDGHVSERISEALFRLTPYVQKRLHYIHDKSEASRISDGNHSSEAFSAPDGKAVQGTVRS